MNETSKLHNPDSTTSTQDEDNAPVDKFNLIYWIFYLQGVGVLFPWNSFISAPDYFSVVMGDQTIFYFSLAYSIPNLLGLVIMVFIGDKIPIIIRIMGAYSVAFFCVLVVPIMALSGIENTPDVGLGICIACLILIALSTSASQGTIFSLAGTLPPKYMQAVMGGNGASGVIVCIIRVITKLILEPPGQENEPTLYELSVSTSIYFFLSAFVIFLSLISFIVVLRHPFSQYYFKKAGQKTQIKQTVYQEIEREKSSINEEEDGHYDVDDTGHEKFPSSVPPPSLLGITKKLWIWEALIFFVFLITLGVFPGLSSIVPSVYGNEMSRWLAIIVITTFNVFDYIGRSLPTVYVMHRFGVWIFTLMRVVFIPLFILCINPKIFWSDAFIIVWMVFMALTNGYFSSCIMMYAPQFVDDHEKVLAGTIMTFMLVLGIAGGSGLGSIFSIFIKPVNITDISNSTFISYL